MLVSILHRVTGDGLALLGAPILVWWLYSISAGPESYETFVNIMTSVPGFIVMIGMTFALFEHLYSGLRHLVLDTGAGYELRLNRKWSIAVPLLALLTTAVFWFFIYVKLIG